MDCQFNTRITKPGPVLARALRDDSNREIEWLWTATEVATDDERRYCLERALYINPHSKAAQQGLRALGRQQAQQHTQAGGHGFGAALASIVQGVFSV